MSTAIAKLADRFGLGNAEEATNILKATAFKGQASDAQMTALCVVAQQYGLNPFTRELYAFPNRNNGIVPVVGVDGWSRIINEAPSFDGMSFEQDDDKCTCTIYRKDRAHPISVTEYMDECRRDTQPWKSHPRRMLRHKAMIQCARIAFGFVGIFDQDEAERIVEKPVEVVVVDAKPLPPELEASAREAAAKGLESYAAFFKALGRDDRLLLQTIHEQLKADAANVPSDV